jgi:hypothetical protein
MISVYSFDLRHTAEVRWVPTPGNPLHTRSDVVVGLCGPDTGAVSVSLRFRC